MKLRNKKTGKIVIVEYISDYQSDDGTEIGFRVKNTLNYYSYPTLAELNKEWEDYKPKEPLIKEKNKRKIIRACAHLDSVKDVKVVKRFSDDTTTLIFGKTTLILKGTYDNLEQCGTYTITELCGEDNEED